VRAVVLFNNLHLPAVPGQPGRRRVVPNIVGATFDSRQSHGRARVSEIFTLVLKKKS
jgi:hypothetical protein